VHAFLKIAFSGLFSLSYEGDDDREPRRAAARLLAAVCDRCQTEFPGIHSMVFDRLVSELFKADTALSCHWGALVAIRQLGEPAIVRLLPHLRSYVRFIACELKSSLFRQGTSVERIRSLLDEILRERIGTNENDEVGLLEVVTKLDI
jgi:hypothetical protein